MKLYFNKMNYLNKKKLEISTKEKNLADIFNTAIFIPQTPFIILFSINKILKLASRNTIIKLIDFFKILGGVPVFNLPIENFNFSIFLREQLMGHPQPFLLGRIYFQA